MNKIQIIIDSVLGAAVIALFVMFFMMKPCCGKSEGALQPAPVREGNMPIAYINIDSLLANYTFAQEANEKLMSKQEDARLKLNMQARSLQNDAAEFQKKVENNAFLSRERAEQEQQRLLKRQQDLGELEQKLQNELLLENQNLNMQLRDTLMNFLKAYNADQRYQIILPNTQKDNVLMASEGYDITDEVVAGLNARYGK